LMEKIKKKNIINTDLECNRMLRRGRMSKKETFLMLRGLGGGVKICKQKQNVK